MTPRPASGLLETLQRFPILAGDRDFAIRCPAMLAAVVCAVMSGFRS